MEQSPIDLSWDDYTPTDVEKIVLNKKYNDMSATKVANLGKTI